MARSRLRTAQLLSEGAERWRSSLREASTVQLVAAVVVVNGLALAGPTIFAVLCAAWAFAQFILGFQPSSASKPAVLVMAKTVMGEVD